jgi:uncharacterized protein
MSQTIKIVLDTNVLLSGIAFPSGVPGKIVAAWRNGSIDVFLSQFILQELRRVLPRLSHRHGLTDDEIDDLLDLLSILAETIEPADPDDSKLRDANDLPVLGTLVAGMKGHSVNYLVTGDKDLLVLSDRYPIVSPGDFWAQHGGL